MEPNTAYSSRIIFKNQNTNFRYKNLNGACVQIPLEEILRVWVFVMIIIINKSFTYKEISLWMCCRYLRKLARYNIRDWPTTWGINPNNIIIYDHRHHRPRDIIYEKKNIINKDINKFSFFFYSFSQTVLVTRNLWALYNASVQRGNNFLKMSSSFQCAILRNALRRHDFNPRGYIRVRFEVIIINID